MNWQIDGVDNNDFWHNIPAVNQGGVPGIAGDMMPIDAMDEFSAQTQSSAEAGRNAGGTVNLVLKSGTNNLHGTAYYYSRNEFYGAAVTLLPTPRQRDQTAGDFATRTMDSLGGPILKDKTFYFVAFEKQKYMIGLSGFATEPSFAWQTQALALLTAHGITPSPISQTSAAAIPTPALMPIPGHRSSMIYRRQPATSSAHCLHRVQLQRRGQARSQFQRETPSLGPLVRGQGSQTAPLGEPGVGDSQLESGVLLRKCSPSRLQLRGHVSIRVISTADDEPAALRSQLLQPDFQRCQQQLRHQGAGLVPESGRTIKGQPILGAPNIAIRRALSKSASRPRRPQRYHWDAGRHRFL